eukprot:TRINITY_DN10388_c0_g1_i3.p1 TRINITY_DN10388_c0_g1~~TRINITY_DN10388_c0_g1_i3.p1  ORF type:complete len:464 (+),score=46.91 TRINITY_DN10388_c0_g1_i3:34-1392(+)
MATPRTLPRTPFISTRAEHQVPLPRDGSVTVCELNCLLVAISNSESANDALTQLKQAQAAIYPLVVVPAASRSTHRLLATQHQSRSFLKNLFHAAVRGELLSSTKQAIQPWIDRLLRRSSPSFQLASAPVRSFAWHPLRAVFAVALTDDTVHVYDVFAESWLPSILQHDQQRNVTTIAWQPCSAATLAVACTGGVCVWTLEQRGAWMRFLAWHDPSPVTAIAWSPFGQYLACGSHYDAVLMIYDVGEQRATQLRRGKGNTNLLRWSPTGYYLFVSTTTSTFRLWETGSWQVETWDNLPLCVAACWSGDGRTLLVATQSDTVMHSFSLPRAPPAIGARYEDRHDITSILPSPQADEMTQRRVTTMCWDDSSERLVVAVNDCELCPVFCTRTVPQLALTPVGAIRGPPHSGLPTSLSFRPNSVRGALLAVAWESAVISFVPMYFKKESELISEY